MKTPDVLHQGQKRQVWAAQTLREQNRRHAIASFERSHGGFRDHSLVLSLLGGKNSKHTPAQDNLLLRYCPVMDGNAVKMLERASAA